MEGAVSFGDFEAFAVMFGAVALVGALASYVFQDQRTKRALRRLRATPIRNAVEGKTMKMVGRVRFVGKPLEAPLSGQPCAAFRVTVDEAGGRLFARIIKEERSVDFLLEDDSGRALVRTWNSTIAVKMDKKDGSSVFHDVNEPMKALLLRHNKTSRGLFFNKDLRYQEGVLQENERVAVIGVVRFETSSDPALCAIPGSYRELPRMVVLDAPENGPLLISDDSDVLN